MLTASVTADENAITPGSTGTPLLNMVSYLRPSVSTTPSATFAVPLTVLENVVLDPSAMLMIRATDTSFEDAVKANGAESRPANEATTSTLAAADATRNDSKSESAKYDGRVRRRR